MKILIYGLVPILSFAVFLIGPLALTGNLSKASLARIVKREPAVPQEGTKTAAPLDGLAQQLRDKEAGLIERETKVKARELQLDQREQELNDLRDRLEAIKAEIDGALQDAETERTIRMETVALTVEGMKADSAAKVLEANTPEDTAEILALVKDKQRSKILDAMNPEFATRVLSSMQQKKL